MSPIRAADPIKFAAAVAKYGGKDGDAASALEAKKRERPELTKARSLYERQLQQLEQYRLKPKGRMQEDGIRRYSVPHVRTPGVRPHSLAGKTITMYLPTPKEVDEDDDVNPGGLKFEQDIPYGTQKWKAMYGLRNASESVNRNLKRSQYENIADPDSRQVRGNTFTYIVVALAAVSENLRNLLNFYKERLLTQPVLSEKNRNVPAAFWQSEADDTPPLLSTA